MKDERLSLDERKEIYREELSTIRDYEQQKRDLRVEQIDNTVTQLTNAITKQLEEMQEKDLKEVLEIIYPDTIFCGYKRMEREIKIFF